MGSYLFNRFEFCIVFLFLLEVNISHAQDKYLEWIRPGTGLAYNVNTESSDYQYIVNINGLYPTLSFRWEMTFPSRNYGDVEISQQAMDTATQEHNYFSGADLYLENETSVWVSKKVYNDLKSQKPVSIDCGVSGSGRELLFFVNNTIYQTQLNDSTIQLPALYAETEKGNKYWILDDPDNPIILKMTIEFNIYLVNIMTEEYLGRE